jgi:hypothetical protein
MLLVASAIISHGRDLNPYFIEQQHHFQVLDQYYSRYRVHEDP